MIGNLLTAKEKITLCENETRYIGERRLDYYLYNLSTLCQKDYFALEVRCGDDSELVVLGCECEAARSVYKAIVEGCVSPVSLFDVVCDAKNKEKY